MRPERMSQLVVSLIEPPPQGVRVTTRPRKREPIAMTKPELDQIVEASKKVEAAQERGTHPMPTMTLDHSTLRKALKANIKPCGGPSNGGLDNHMWAAVVDRNGVVKAVCFS